MLFLSTCAYEPIRIFEVMSGNDLSVGLFAKLPKDANQIASFGNITGQKCIYLQHSTDDRWGASKCIGWAEETSWGGASRELLPDRIMFPMFNYVQLPFEILDHDGIKPWTWDDEYSRGGPGKLMLVFVWTGKDRFSFWFVYLVRPSMASSAFA